MKVLGLDTSTLMTTCAVIDDDKLIGEYSLSQDMSHSEKLVPMVEEMLKNVDLKIKDMDLFAVSLGPGSFTGLRIGLASVKAFAHITDKPLVGVSTLEALAFNLPYNRIVVPMIDARRQRVYTGIYAWEGEELKTLLDPCILEIQELLEKLKSYDDLVVNGDGAIAFKEEIKKNLGNKVRFSTLGLNMCKASSICELARIKYNKGQRDDYFTLSPDYLLETQAQRELNERGK
ncbi:tRNA (adenosine(37)-N6)-threonylcarbamoyltransferase complex dimerization subunit type 1 TsaB [Tissierella creatinini]|nr:tRNA (adenosine(37)-N6)-threonylcarbamoyltransferase complex dimerization subunit type 1 TsaB [Tissierella creatinini]TJX66352.1 tRNA (adenosine(37)-N6)-threonylcarbamoyltransferase complex dimerization subunit type 1 TsaB [Soehngenia saccharolytica]